MARTQILQAMTNHVGASLSDCAKLYDESESRLARLLSGEGYTDDDARTWLSGVLANQRSCMDGLGEKGYFVEADHHVVAKNLTALVGEALDLFGKSRDKRKGKWLIIC